MLKMDLLSFVIGILIVTVGSSASLAGGLYLILGSTVMLAAFVLLVVAGGAHQAHVRRERNRQGLGTV